MHRILFVCHGNICRSVSTQYIFQDLVNRRGLASEFVRFGGDVDGGDRECDLSADAGAAQIVGGCSGMLAETLA